MESFLLQTKVFEWFKAYNERPDIIKNLAHASFPSTSIDDGAKVKETELKNHPVGIKEIAKELKNF